MFSQELLWLIGYYVGYQPAFSVTILLVGLNLECQRTKKTTKQYVFWLGLLVSIAAWLMSTWAFLILGTDDLPGLEQDLDLKSMFLVFVPVAIGLVLYILTHRSREGVLLFRWGGARSQQDVELVTHVHT